MALDHATSGEVLNLLADAQSPEFISQALVSTPSIELMRLVLKAGKLLPPHAVAGPITVQCLRGSIEVQAGGIWHAMHDNDLMYVAEQAEHAVRATTDAIVLVTLVRLPQAASAPDSN